MWALAHELWGGHNSAHDWVSQGTPLLTHSETCSPRQGTVAQNQVCRTGRGSPAPRSPGGGGSGTAGNRSICHSLHTAPREPVRV